MVACVVRAILSGRHLVHHPRQMAIMVAACPRPRPDGLAYRFTMPIAMMAGFVTAVRANALLVRAGLKEAM
jgi:hypothetical protein